MEGSGAAVAGHGADSADSWNEVVAISATMEQMFKEGAVSDAARLRAIVQRRKEIAAEVDARQAASERQLQHLLVNLREWEDKEGATRARNEQLQIKLQELEALRREMNLELERFRQDEQSSKQSLDKLVDQYEEARLKFVEYTMQHQNEVPAAKHQMSLYASVTGIKWDFSGDKIAGDIHVPAKQTVVRFEVDPTTDPFETANSLWDQIDSAFDDLDGTDL